MNRFLTNILLIMIVCGLGFYSVAAQNFKCGDKLRITHSTTGANLHSHPINYNHPGTSGQQQVTAYQGADDNDLWVLEDCSGNPLKSGSIFRLRHFVTGQYLHSHQGYPAPITSGQQEITAWTGKDSNDMWQVEFSAGGSWSADKKVRLIHLSTNAALHSHNITGGALPSQQQEVTGYSGRDANDFWTAAIARETGNSGNPGNPGYPGNPGNGNDLIFQGNIQRADIFSRLSFSNNGNINYTLSIKNRDNYVGSCVVFYINLADSRGNIVRTLGGDQYCVDGRQPMSSRAEREERLRYSITNNEASRARSVQVIFTPGGKISPDLFRGNLNQIDQMLNSCPECVRKTSSLGFR